MFVCYDRTLHKFWVICVNSVYRYENGKVCDTTKVRDGPVQYNMVRDGTGQYGMVQNGTGRYGTVQDGTGRYRAVPNGTGRYGTGQYRTLRWYGTGWYRTFDFNNYFEYKLPKCSIFLFSASRVNVQTMGKDMRGCGGSLWSSR